MKKRDLFAEMMQDVSEMAAQREGKLPCASTKVRIYPFPR